MGRWQQREQYLALDRQAQNPSFPVIPVLLPGTDPALGFLSLNTWIDLRAGISHPVTLSMLAEAVQGRPAGPQLRQQTAAALATICPYRGLRYFREEDAPFFFGRDAFIERLTSALTQHQLVAVVGASGSGKSSVVRSGLVPRLRQHGGTHTWDVVTILPGENPLQSLAAGFVPLLEPNMTEVDRLREVGKLSESFASAEISLGDVVSRTLEKQPGTDRLLLIVDQWEELYTLTHDESARKRFLDELLRASASSAMSAVLTLRGEFFDHALAYRPLSDRLQGAVVNISRMTREELRQAIELPAQKVGLRFETGLVNRILDKVEGQPGNLPLLEFVLTELWKERQGDVLTHATYEEMGEVQGAVASHAEKVFERLLPAEQEVTRRVFSRLVSVGAEIERTSENVEARYTRRRATFNELGEESRPVLRKLADSHLIVTGRNEATGEETVDLVHEALFKAWDRLRKWIDEDRQFLLWREQLRTLLDISAASHYDNSTLLQGKLLAEAQERLARRKADLSAREQKYIQDSIEFDSRKTLLRWAAIAGGSLAVVLASALFFYQNRLPTSGVTNANATPQPQPSPSVTAEERPTPGKPTDTVFARDAFSLTPPQGTAVVVGSIDRVPSISPRFGGDFSVRFQTALKDRTADENRDGLISIAEATDKTAQVFKEQGSAVRPMAFGSAGDIALYSTSSSPERYAHVHAVLIAIEDYGPSKLPGALKDIENFKNLLEEPGNQLFGDVKIISLPNEKATRGGILQEIRKLKSTSTEDDLVVVYFSGMFVYRGDGKSNDAVPSVATHDDLEKGIGMLELMSLLQELKAKQRLIIFDA